MPRWPNKFVWDLVANLEDRFSHGAAHIPFETSLKLLQVLSSHRYSITVEEKLSKNLATCTYRILTEFKVFTYWKDPPRANRGAEPRSGEALRFVRAGLSST